MKLSHSMHLALEAWPALDRDTYISNAHAIAYLAMQHDVSASGLYRALVKQGKIVRKPRKTTRKGK